MDEKEVKESAEEITAEESKEQAEETKVSEEIAAEVAESAEKSAKKAPKAKKEEAPETEEIKEEAAADVALEILKEDVKEEVIPSIQVSDSEADVAGAEVESEQVEEAIDELIEEEELLPARERPARSRKDRDRDKGKRRKPESAEAPVSEWKEVVVQIRRVTKVVKGGKKLSFRAIVVVGNQKGQVGVGCAKAAEVIIAIQKAIADGRKSLVTVPIFKTTIPHPTTGRSGAGSVMLRPASQGTGVIAGGAVRAVLELAGIENILSKSLGSKSPLNAAGATIDALKSLRTFNTIAAKRGMTLKEMLN